MWRQRGRVVRVVGFALWIMLAHEEQCINIIDKVAKAKYHVQFTRYKNRNIYLRKKGFYPFSSLFRVTSVILYKLWLAYQTKWRNPITPFLLVSTFHCIWSYLTKTLPLHAFSWVSQTLCILYGHCWQHYYFIGFLTLYMSSSDLTSK